MSLFWNTLEEHRDLLKSRGYDEAALDSPDKEGWFMRQLELSFSKALKDSFATGEKTEFEIKTAAFFNNDADVVLFRFGYEYDPETTSLNIASLEVDMGDKTLNLDLKSNKDLPLAKSVYNNLALGKKLVIARNIANHRVNGKGRRL